MFKLVGSMLKKALARLRPTERPVLHSDQGWHYQQPSYRRMLGARSVTQSMSRKGNCLDNAAMESFFGTLKAEFFHLNRFESIKQLQAGIRQYIRYYNHDRIKLKLKGLSPAQYRAQAFGLQLLTVQLMGSSSGRGPFHSRGIQETSVRQSSLGMMRSGKALLSDRLNTSTPRAFSKAAAWEKDGSISRSKLRTRRLFSGWASL
ncbi:hypothetical protein BOSP111201_05810 [Bordetella sputigena]